MRFRMRQEGIEQENDAYYLLYITNINWFAIIMLCVVKYIRVIASQVLLLRSYNLSLTPQNTTQKRHNTRSFGQGHLVIFDFGNVVICSL